MARYRRRRGYRVRVARGRRGRSSRGRRMVIGYRM